MSTVKKRFGKFCTDDITVKHSSRSRQPFTVGRGIVPNSIENNSRNSTEETTKILKEIILLNSGTCRSWTTI